MEKPASLWMMIFQALLFFASLSGRAASQWKTIYEENADTPLTLNTHWSADTYPDDGIYSDQGEYFQKRGIHPPSKAFRASQAFGKNGWLTFESYSRSKDTKIPDLISIQENPDGSPTRALRISSPVHTDATLIRSTQPLPREYRICVQVGYADFGDGKADKDNLNGYLGGEKAGPWSNYDSTRENGFYWLTILDSLPRPHNNIWMHHHRKVVIDSDNNKEAWTNIWDGHQFVASGEHPVMMFGLSKDGEDQEQIGKPFISYSAGKLQPVGEIRAADAYLDRSWYTACIERTRGDFKLKTSGKFKFGGNTGYEAVIPAARIYQADAQPEYFMLGDPHNNFYRGSVYYRGLRMEVPQK